VHKILPLGKGAFLKKSAPINPKFNDCAWCCKIYEISIFHVVFTPWFGPQDFYCDDQCTTIRLDITGMPLQLHTPLKMTHVTDKKKTGMQPFATSDTIGKTLFVQRREIGKCRNIFTRVGQISGVWHVWTAVRNQWSWVVKLKCTNQPLYRLTKNFCNFPVMLFWSLGKRSPWNRSWRPRGGVQI